MNTFEKIKKKLQPKVYSVEEILIRSRRLSKIKAIVAAIIAFILGLLAFLVSANTYFIWFGVFAIYLLKHLSRYLSLSAKRKEVKKARFFYHLANYSGFFLYAWILFIITLYVVKLMGG